MSMWQKQNSNLPNKTQQDNRLEKAWAAWNKMNNTWKSTLSENLKGNFVRATVESVLVYDSISWTLTSTPEKNIDGDYTRMSRTALNRSWDDHVTNIELYGKIPSVTVTQEQPLRFADELCSEVIL